MTELEIEKHLERERDRLEFLEKMWRAGYKTQRELARVYGAHRHGCPIDKGWMSKAVSARDPNLRSNLVVFVACFPAKKNGETDAG